MSQTEGPVRATESEDECVCIHVISPKRLGAWYVIGGRDEDPQLYEKPYEKRTTALHGCACVSIGSSVFIFGGFGRSGVGLDGISQRSAKIDFAQDNLRTMQMSPMRCRRMLCSAVVAENKVYVTGGGVIAPSNKRINPPELANRGEVFDLQSGRWIDDYDCPREVVAHTRTWIARDENSQPVLLANSLLCDSLHRFDPYTKKWELWDEAFLKEWWFHESAIQNNIIYVSGGEVEELRAYDWQRRRWCLEAVGGLQGVLPRPGDSGPRSSFHPVAVGVDKLALLWVSGLVTLHYAKFVPDVFYGTSGTLVRAQVLSSKTFAFGDWDILYCLPLVATHKELGKDDINKKEARYKEGEEEGSGNQKKKNTRKRIRGRKN